MISKGFTESTEMANKAVELLRNKKAKEIKLLDIHEISTIADYFIIVTGSSTTQVQAMADELEEKMGKMEYKMHHKEGFRGGRWILMDYGNVVIHVFHDEERKFYNLDRIWVDAKTVLYESDLN